MAIGKVIIRLLRIGILLFGVLALSFLGGCWKWFVEKQVFFPDKTIVQTPAHFNLSFEDVWFTSSDSVSLHGWLISPPASRHILLFCHGNAGNISHRLDNVRLLHKRGISVFIFDYRGYGRSHGRISEKGFYLDSEAAHDVVREWAEKHRAKLIIFGRSLEAKFTNMAAMARAHYPLPFADRLLKHRLNAVGEIHQVRVPILFFHGDNDRIVPLRLGRELYETAPNPKEFVVIPGAGHNDTFYVAGKGYFDKLQDFVEKL